MKTMDSTILSKLFYFLNCGAYLYHKKISCFEFEIYHYPNIYIYKVIYRFYTLLFVISFLKNNLKNKKSPKHHILFLLFWNFFLKMGAIHMYNTRLITSVLHVQLGSRKHQKSINTGSTLQNITKESNTYLNRN